MLGCFADCVSKDVKNHLADDEKEYSKGDMSERPSILESGSNENDLRDDIYKEKDTVDEVEHHEETESVGLC